MMTSSASNRSFRLPSRILSNRQNQSFPFWSNADSKSLEASSSATQKPIPSPSKSSRQNTSTSSFWAEWADEMQLNDENRGNSPHQIVLFNDDRQHCSSSFPKNLSPPSDSSKAKNKSSDTKLSPLMASQLVINSSMNSVSVMNISLGPMRFDHGNPEGDLDQLHDAMTDNMAAQHLLESEKYQECMIIYRKAIRQFVKICDEENRVIAGVNAASCYRNMSTAARMLKQFEEATKCLALAVAWYLKSHALVTKQAQKSVVTLDGKMIDNSFMSPNKSVTSLTDTASIDELLIESLHAQAKLHVEYKGNVAGAFAAYDSVLAHLVELDKLEQWKSASTTLLYVDGVVFTAPTLVQQTAWLAESLRTLGDFYMGYNQFSDTPLALFEKGIDILQSRFEESETKSDDKIRDLAMMLRQLSEIYFSRQLHDHAADALHDSASVQLRATGKPDEDALRVLEKVGAANERARCYDQARSCYEQIMVARSKYYGTTDLSVAKALFDIGRTIEKKSGSTMESDEILKTANSILALHLVEEVPELRQAMDLVMRLLPCIQPFNQSCSVVNDLDKSLSELHGRPYDGLIDKPQIYFDLGRGFMRHNKHLLASVCINQAIREAKGCESDQVENLSQSMRVNAEMNPSISLVGEDIDLQDTPQSKASLIKKENTDQPERPGAIEGPLFTKEKEPELAFPSQESSVLQETDPSMYFFEDEQSETFCHQPTKRDKSYPVIRGESTADQQISCSLKVKTIKPILKKPCSAKSEKPVERKSLWRQLFCPILSTAEPICQRSPKNTSRESLKPIIGQRKLAAPQITHKSRSTARSKLITKLCTIPESMSFGHEDDDQAARHLLNSSNGSVQSSSCTTRNPREITAYTTLSRKHYAAV